MMMKRVGLAFVVATLAATGVTTTLLAGDSTPPWVDELNRLSRFIGQSASPDQIGSVDDTKFASKPEVRALRSALLYRADPARYGADFEANFAIDDYAMRARGKTTDISQQDFLARIKDVESTYPSLSPQLVMLVSFVRSREANMWFVQAEQHVSVARFLRGAFLAQVFKGSTLDAATVAGSLDQTTREKYEKSTKQP
jgi:hypothetical protein